MKKILVSLILFISVFLITKDMVFMLLLNSSNDKMVKAYFNNNSSFKIVSSYFTGSPTFNYKSDMVLNIPSINLETVVKKADNEFKLLDRYLVYYKNNNYKKGIVILGHSGMGYGTYFNRLDELDNKSNVYIYKDKLKLTYQFKEKMDVKETQINILNSAKANELILITCKKSVKDERLVVKLVLKSAKTIDK